MKRLAAVYILVAGFASAAPLSLQQLEVALAAGPNDLRAANDYRLAVIQTGEHDRAIDFFKKLVADHPDAPYAWLNYGYAYVDKIPAAGSITQVILANTALTNFTRSIELERSWIALYTRGNSYLFWPKIFGRGPLAVADLEEAVAVSKKLPKKKVYARAWVGLGDAHWRTDQPERAKATWKEALALFPGDPQLEARLAHLAGGSEKLEAYIYEQLDPNQRVDTNLAPLWEEP